ncbi:zinc-binding metallopeptidase family protein [Pseudonocardia pini]|uniref:zinc-binding metallopeptidase family protein n=1 Tax=Pseudonocardia pini TaxID=2758030 RepID=UPI0015F00C11|nr:putative zinc-binding metallopeptidase [Pseudonocardia pini]
MRAFACPHCSFLVYFENSVCLNCSTEISYSRSARSLVRTAEGDPCANLTLATCNWLAPDPGGLCDCCALTRTRPADDDVEGMKAFALTEQAKRRLLFQIDDLGLPLAGRATDPVGGLAFDLLSSAHEPVTTGHASGIVTLDLAEGDAGHREQMRVQLAEPYRTLLGHLRHETGHWYWEVLVDRPGRTADFRALFGDESESYMDALERHYSSEPAPGWEESYVSTYATAHPWEDWAETFAHYLHIRDTSQTASAFGISVHGPALTSDPEESEKDFDALVETWLPLTAALNAVNRSMGYEDLYPFVLAPTVLDKLRFVHDLVIARPAYVPAAG